MARPPGPLLALALLLCWADRLQSAHDHDRLPFEHATFKDHARTTERAPVMSSELIFTRPPGRFEAHASTIVEVEEGVLLAAWFAGTEENAPDVAIWASHFHASTRKWEKPKEVVPPLDRKAVTCGRRLESKCKGTMSTWNPVLARLPSTGEILLWYKVGPSPTAWTGYIKRSADGGKTWGEPEKMPEGIAGPAKNKPMVLADGTILAGSSTEGYGKTTATGGQERVWKAWLDRSSDGGRTWERTGPVPFDGNVIQPAIVEGPGGLPLMFMRTATDYDLATRKRADPYRSPYNRKKMVTPGKKYVIVTQGTTKKGDAWKPAFPVGLPCPNSGIDAANLADGRIVIVFNDSFEAKAEGRMKLGLAVSEDEGRTWRKSVTLEDAKGPVKEYSYPAVIQGADGRIHVTYTYNRESIKHCVIDPDHL